MDYPVRSIPGFTKADKPKSMALRLELSSFDVKRKFWKKGITIFRSHDKVNNENANIRIWSTCLVYQCYGNCKVLNYWK